MLCAALGMRLRALDLDWIEVRLHLVPMDGYMAAKVPYRGGSLTFRTVFVLKILPM